MKSRFEVIGVDLLPPAIGYLSRATVRAVAEGDLRRGRDSEGVVNLELLKRAFPVPLPSLEESQSSDPIT